MKLFTSKDRLVNHLYYPIAFLSFILIVVYFISLLPSATIDINLISSLLWSALCGLIAYKEYNNTRKSLVLGVSVLLANIVIFSISNRPFGFVISVAVALSIFYITRNLDLEFQFMTSVLLAVIIGLVLGVSNDYILGFVKLFAKKIKGNGMVFGIINEVYSSFFGDYFSRLFYYTDYASATVVNDNIVTGAVSIFRQSKKEPFSITATYLTGKYFANIFLPLGVIFALYSRTKNKHFYPFILSSILSIVCGNNALLLLFLFFYNPLIFIAFCLITGLCYFVSAIVDIRLGFVHSASIVEMLIHSNKMLYFLLIGIIYSVMMYYVIQIILSKFDLDNQQYFPREVRQLLKSLGGQRNIERLEQGILYVKNPNLIDILKVDCDIHQNQVFLIDNDYELLKEYF